MTDELEELERLRAVIAGGEDSARSRDEFVFALKANGTLPPDFVLHLSGEALVRDALGALLWVLKKRGDAGGEAWEKYAAEAEQKGYAAVEELNRVISPEARVRADTIREVVEALEDSGRTSAVRFIEHKFRAALSTPEEPDA